MSSDQAIEVMAYRKVDVLTPGEAQDIGETLHLALAGTGEGDRIGAPIHLTLFRFVSNRITGSRSGARSFLSRSLRMLMPPG